MRILQEALAQGMLTLDEEADREQAAYAAKYRHELAPLTVDLPDSLGWRSPEAVAAMRRGVRVHAGVLALLAAASVTMWVMSPILFFWPIFPLAFLALGLVGRARWARYGPPGRGWGSGPSQRPWDGPWGPRSGQGQWGPGYRGPGPWDNRR